MNIEEFVISYLNTALSVTVPGNPPTVLAIPVYGDVPSPVPDQFVTVEMTGASEENKIRYATIAVQSWDVSRDAASNLNIMVITAMEAIISKDEISSCSLDSSYNYTDLTRNKPRYQAVFSVVY